MESCSRGTGCHANSSDWANKEGDDQTVHCEGLHFSPKLSSKALSCLFSVIKDLKITSPVTYGWRILTNLHFLVFQGTVEERMEAVQARKQRIISGALTDQEVRSARIEELKMLFT